VRESAFYTDKDVSLQGLLTRRGHWHE
jgi:hypothetical protein